MPSIIRRRLQRIGKEQVLPSKARYGAPQKITYFCRCIGYSERMTQSLDSSTPYVRPQRIDLKTHPALNEKWVQDRIAGDPKLLGLDDLILRDRERVQPRAGRLDLLLQDAETKRRYQVELQLGATDETHIIRTVEYWDIERKRYPQYDHCAVLIAANITSRFLNVIALFNGTIPFIAIQMQALTVGSNLTLVFTTVMDEFSRGLVDEDEDAAAAPADRAYWESRGTKASVSMADDLFKVVHEFDPALELKYNEFYIGLAKAGRPNNVVEFRPQKNGMIFEVRLKQSDELQQKIDHAGLDTLEYSRWGYYRFKVMKDDPKKRAPFLREIIGLAVAAGKSHKPAIASCLKNVAVSKDPRSRRRKTEDDPGRPPFCQPVRGITLGYSSRRAWPDLARRHLRLTVASPNRRSRQQL